MSIDLPTTLCARRRIVVRLRRAALEGPGRLTVLEGEAGVGKTAIADALAHAAAAEDWHVRWLATPAAAATRSSDGRRSLLVVDLDERRHAADHAAWSRLLMRVGSEDRVVVVARAVPQPLWRFDPHVLQAPRLDRHEAIEIAEQMGVAPWTRDALADWAEGFPLMLVLGAQHALTFPAWVPEAGDDPAELSDRLLRRLFGGGVTLSAPLVALAQGARLDRDALAAVAGEPGAVEAAVASTLVSALPTGYRLHALAARALAAVAHRVDPSLEREVRRRLAEHLLAGAARRGIRTTAPLSQLARRSRFASAYRWSEEVATRAALPHDAELVREALEAAGQEGRWARVAGWFEHAPERVSMAVGADGRPLAYAIAVAAHTASPVAAADPFVTRCLEHARSASADGGALILRDSCDVRAPHAGAAVTPAQACAHVAAVLHAGHPNPRFLYAPKIDEAALPPTARATALDGAVLVDFGVGGLLGAQRALVLHEAGLAPSTFEPAGGDRRALVEEVVRKYHCASVLAASPLGAGATAAERVASVRAMVDAAVDHVFGDSFADRQLREVLRTGYLAPVAGHERAAFDLAMSRSTYFRKLRLALARVVDALAA